MTTPFHCVLDARAGLGEGPTWSARESVLYWIDIDAPSLNRFDPATGRNDAMPMPAAIGAFALRARGGFIVALRDGVWLADAHGALERCVFPAPYDPHHHRFNDGRCDPAGRFVVGTMNEQRDAASGMLYSIAGDGCCTTLFGDITISNGLAFSPDGRTMYHSDTPAHVIRAFDYDAVTGTPSRQRTFVQWTGETDRPDGGVVDSEGNYWSAFYRGGKVVKLSPAGRILAEFPTPAMCPTMCAFGGPDLRTLYLTTSRRMRPDDELARLPQSGGLFAMQVDVPGLPDPAFAG